MEFSILDGLIDTPFRNQTRTQVCRFESRGLDAALGDDHALRQVLQLVVMGQGQLDEPRGDATPLVTSGQ